MRNKYCILWQICQLFSLVRVQIQSLNQRFGPKLNTKITFNTHPPPTPPRKVYCQARPKPSPIGVKAWQKGCVNMQQFRSFVRCLEFWAVIGRPGSWGLYWPIRFQHWWTRIYHLLMKAWPGDIPVGMLGDLQGMFSSVTGRVKFTFHIWVLGPSEVCAV